MYTETTLKNGRIKCQEDGTGQRYTPKTYTISISRRDLNLVNTRIPEKAKTLFFEWLLERKIEREWLHACLGNCAKVKLHVIKKLNTIK